MISNRMMTTQTNELCCGSLFILYTKYIHVLQICAKLYLGTDIRTYMYGRPQTLSNPLNWEKIVIKIMMFVLKN